MNQEGWKVVDGEGRENVRTKGGKGPEEGEVKRREEMRESRRNRNRKKEKEEKLGGKKMSGNQINFSS